jgi:D-tyrosyl-tRNA(Tyr) deacylase
VKIVLQRVSRAEVRVEGVVVGSIGPGHLLLVGFGHEDGTHQIEWMADKVLGLRIFADDEGKMNRSLEEAGGDLLVVSQFTLYGDSSKGRRPSFVAAAVPAEAELLYEQFVETLRGRTTCRVDTGLFGAMMNVELVNDGPVTLVLER